jgi:hypothetical protein
MLDNLQAFPTIPTTDVICFIILLSKSVAIVLQGNPQSRRSLTRKLYEEIILVFVISFHPKL